MEDTTNANNNFFRKPEGTRPLGGCEDNIRTDLREMWCEGVDWVHLAQDGDQWQALVIMVMDIS
jgi:hypothetical protein